MGTALEFLGPPAVVIAALAYPSVLIGIRGTWTRNRALAIVAMEALKPRKGLCCGCGARPIGGCAASATLRLPVDAQRCARGRVTRTVSGHTTPSETPGKWTDGTREVNNVTLPNLGLERRAKNASGFVQTPNGLFIAGRADAMPPTPCYSSLERSRRLESSHSGLRACR